MSDDLTERLARLACEGLLEIAEGFSDDLDRTPTVNELCELLTAGIQSTNENLLADVQPGEILSLRPRLRDGRQATPESALGELNDGVFTAANGLWSDLAHAYHGETGDRPMLSTMCEVIVEGLHGCVGQIISDADPADVVSIESELREGGTRSSRPGDVVAIPGPNGARFNAVVVAKNTSGTAYGVLEETTESNRAPSIRAPHPFYSGDAPVEDGTWPIIGHDDGLLEHFPSEPERFYLEPLVPDVEPEMGPYGSAQSPEGEWRDLSEKESREVGLLDGSYREFHPPELVGEYLAKRLHESENGP